MPQQFTILDLRPATVEIADARGYRSTVFLRYPEKGTWVCLRCSRSTCIHATWVAQQNPTLPSSPELTEADLAELIDE